MCTHMPIDWQAVAKSLHSLTDPQVEINCNSPSFRKVSCGCVQGSGHKHFVIPTPGDVKSGSATLRLMRMPSTQSGITSMDKCVLSHLPISIHIDSGNSASKVATKLCG